MELTCRRTLWTSGNRRDEGNDGLTATCLLISLKKQLPKGLQDDSESDATPATPSAVHEPTNCQLFPLPHRQSLPCSPMPAGSHQT
ncbi:hypothetical protein LEMLEM_LOCUS15765 [Lemmus lemmus]